MTAPQKADPKYGANKQEREDWLKQPGNRDSVKRIGSGSIYTKGPVSDVRNTKIIVSMRAEEVGRGLAHFGGLSEDEDKVPGDDLATGINSACREGMEEMEELLSYEPPLKTEKYEFLYTASDDNFFVNNGFGFAVDSRLHTYPMAEWTTIFPEGITRRDRHENAQGPRETEFAEVTTVFNALTRQKEYFYMHEYFALLVLAAKSMNEDVMDLVKAVNVEIKANQNDGEFVAKPNKNIVRDRVDFNFMAKRMNTDLETLENHLGPEYKGKITAYEKTFSR